jgi:outer membrane lipopolysaccharide assembly protein LptE/RlpB
MKGNTMKRTGILFIGTILLIILAGCGYQLIGGKGIYGGDISSIYVSVFKNSTYEPAISQPVTDSFSKELLMTGLFTLNKESADGYLRGEITDIITQPSSLGADGVVIEKVVSVTLSTSLFQRNGKLVKNFTLSDSEIYKIQNTAEEYNRREAIRRLSARLARRFSAQLLLEY